MKLFCLRVHPCPECFGNVRWYAQRCPHCQAGITNADRYEWMSQPAKVTFFATITIAVFAAGVSVLRLAGVIGVF